MTNFWHWLGYTPKALGGKEGKLSPCPHTPNCVHSQAEGAGHHIEPIPFTGPAAEARKKLEEVLKKLPRTRIITATEDYLHAECTSLILRFVDDVEFQIDAANHMIHCRSASRVGRSDFGVNRRRIEAIRRELENQ